MPLELGGEVYMLSNRLKRKGFETLIAGRGYEWIEIAQNELPDLILVDMTYLTPQEDDFMIRSLKTVQASQKTPIISLVDKKRLLEKQNIMDIDDYDIKPIEVPRLLEKINRLLSKQEPKTQ